MKISEFYNKVAPVYENLINSPKINAKLTGEAKKVFLKYKIVEGSILDVGCGPGNLKTAFGDKFLYTGVDISESMLLKAKEKGYVTIYGRIEDVLKEIPDKSFDYVISLSALHFVKDINSVLKEFDRISKKGWLVSLLDVTENYTKDFLVDEPIYNHSKIVLPDTSEDFLFDAWISPAQEQMRERMIFKKSVII